MHILTHVQVISLARLENAFDKRCIVKNNIAEIFFAFLVKIAELPHFLIDINQFAVSIIERHRNQIRLKYLHVFLTRHTVDTLLINLMRDVFHRIDHIARLAVLFLDDGVALQIVPVRFNLATQIEATGESPQVRFS